MDYKIVIPARWGSTRFHGKPIIHINGKPMIQHVYENALKTSASDIIIATDNETIENICIKFGAEVIMTGEHLSGTSRIYEIAENKSWTKDEIIINLQGDEPTMHHKNIHKIAQDIYRHVSCDVSTLSCPITNEKDLHNPNIVKVITDINGHAIYFSRNPLKTAQRHIGIYAFRGSSLKYINKLEPCDIEKEEKLEQLRILYNGGRIHVTEAPEPIGPSVDVPNDIDLVEKYLNEYI